MPAMTTAHRQRRRQEHTDEATGMMPWIFLAVLIPLSHGRAAAAPLLPRTDHRRDPVARARAHAGRQGALPRSRACGGAVATAAMAESSTARQAWGGRGSDHIRGRRAAARTCGDAGNVCHP